MFSQIKSICACMNAFVPYGHTGDGIHDDESVCTLAIWAKHRKCEYFCWVFVLFFHLFGLAEFVDMYEEQYGHNRTHTNSCTANTFWMHFEEKHKKEKPIHDGKSVSESCLFDCSSILCVLRPPNVGWKCIWVVNVDSDDNNGCCLHMWSFELNGRVGWTSTSHMWEKTIMHYKP